MNTLSSFSAIVLLCLLSMSFILENSILLESEKTELLDRSEKDKDKKESKEKKLFFSSELIVASLIENARSLSHKLSNLDILNGVFPDVLTPPPELV